MSQQFARVDHNFPLNVYYITRQQESDVALHTTHSIYERERKTCCLTVWEKFSIRANFFSFQIINVRIFYRITLICIKNISFFSWALRNVAQLQFYCVSQQLSAVYCVWARFFAPKPRRVWKFAIFAVFFTNSLADWTWKKWCFNWTNESDERATPLVTSSVRSLSIVKSEEMCQLNTVGRFWNRMNVDKIVWSFFG